MPKADLRLRDNRVDPDNITAVGGLKDPRLRQRRRGALLTTISAVGCATGHHSVVVVGADNAMRRPRRAIRPSRAHIASGCITSGVSPSRTQDHGIAATWARVTRRARWRLELAHVRRQSLIRRSVQQRVTAIHVAISTKQEGSATVNCSGPICPVYSFADCCRSTSPCTV